MGENKVLVTLVYVTVIIFGGGAGALGFVAEKARIKESDIEVTKFGCSYPNSSAELFGYIAAVLLLIQQIILSVVVTRCVCCWKWQRETFNTATIVQFIISSSAAITGIILLVSAPNLKIRKEFLDATVVCYTVRPVVYGMGGQMAVVACSLGLCAYCASIKHRRSQHSRTTAPPQDDTVMGYPQLSTSTYPKQQQHC